LEQASKNDASLNTKNSKFLVASPSTTTQSFSPTSLVGAAFSKYYVGYGDCLGTIVRYDKDTQQYIGQFVEGDSEISFSPEELAQRLVPTATPRSADVAPSTTSPTTTTSATSATSTTAATAATSATTSLLLNVDVPLFSATSTKPPTPVNHTNDGSHSPSTPDTNACVPPLRPVDILPSHIMSPKSKSSSTKKKKKKLYTKATATATHAATHATTHAAAPPKPQTLASVPPPEATKKGPWTEAEDATVLEGVRRLQLEGHTGKLMKHIKWSDLALAVPGRSGKQVRERWYNHLDPTINKGPWTAAEMLVLHDVHARLGNQWSKIADHLPGRTQNHIKNRWNSIKRKSDRVTGADGRKSRAYRKRCKSGGGGGGRAEDEARQRSYSNLGESAAARYGGNPRKRSMSTNDVGDSLDEFFASNSPRSRKRTRTSASLSSSLSSSSSSSSFSSSSFSSSSRPCSPTFGFGTSVDLQALSISMQGWMLQPANNEEEQGDPEERDHPLMRYLERCPTSCELDELTNVSHYLKDESTRMQHMMEWLAKDIENENVPQPQQGPLTSPPPQTQTQPAPPQPSPTNPKEELWRPESLVSAFPLELPITANHIDWWERSMTTPTSDHVSDHVARGDRNQGVSLSSMMVGVGHIMGAGLLNKAVQIEWGEEDKKWYGGRCVEWVAPQHKIQYDNGEVEWISLYREFDNGVVWRRAPV